MPTKSRFTEEDSHIMVNVVARAGLLPRPVTVYLGLLPNMARIMREEWEEGEFISLKGLQYFMMDPDEALYPGATALVVLEAKSGMHLPNHSDIIIQANPQYKTTHRENSPSGQDGFSLDMFYHEEVVSGDV